VPVESSPKRASEEDSEGKKITGKLAAKLPFLDSKNSIPKRKDLSMLNLDVIEEERLS
jgi:hypothetical protein